jgi:hypothetical protein
MRARKLAIVSIAALPLMAACGVGSVSPLLSDADVRFEPRLVGTWRAPDSKEFAVFAAAGSNGYSIAYSENDGKVGHFVAHLGRVGSRPVLDLEPAELPGEWSDSYKQMLLPLHGLIVIDSIGRELRFRVLDPDSLKALLAREPQAIAHVLRKEGVILTAPTADVQRFLTTYLERPGVLGAADVWRHQMP